MEQIEKERFFTMADSYNKMAQKLVPKYDFLQNEVFNIIEFNQKQKIVLVDLGAGSGIFIEKFLKRYPGSTAFWIDYSEDFLKVAQNRLSKFTGKVNYILSSLEENWENYINIEPDIIFSMSAIHHLNTDEKKELYKKCYNILKVKGWFINIDETKTIFNEAYKNSLHFWAKYVDAQKNNIKNDDIEYYLKWIGYFNNWKERNIENINLPKQKGDDLHENFVNQVKWLHEIGFKNTDVYIKYHLWSIIGGQKSRV